MKTWWKSADKVRLKTLLLFSYFKFHPDLKTYIKIINICKIALKKPFELKLVNRICTIRTNAGVVQSTRRGGEVDTDAVVQTRRRAAHVSLLAARPGVSAAALALVPFLHNNRKYNPRRTAEVDQH